ncbi:MAG: hypothetical protein GY822_20420 [Deltaproteobacteria bacterium]|nr:hypothetical protein [Deltaproteobacteria bacterium]
MGSTLDQMTLLSVGGEILADAAFKFLDPADDASFSDDVVHASLEYRTDFEAGTLHFTSTSPFALDLAANLLGCDPEDDEAAEQELFAMGEMVNVLAGALLAHVVGDADVSLGIPENQRRSADDWQNVVGGAQTLKADFEDEEGNTVSICVTHASEEEGAEK